MAFEKSLETKSDNELTSMGRKKVHLTSYTRPVSQSPYKERHGLEPQAAVLQQLMHEEDKYSEASSSTPLMDN